MRVCKRDKIQKSKVTQLYETYYLVSGAHLPRMSLTSAFCGKQKWNTLEKRKMQRDKKREGDGDEDVTNTTYMQKKSHT